MSGTNIDTKRLIRLREERTWSRDLMSKRTGLSPSAIAKIENGERRPSISTLALICDALGCEPADLLAPLEETG
jgi:transcriptional regulator with XRE-family HTH domain